MVNGEETAGHLTGDCADVAGPPRSAAPSLCGRFWASATSPNPLPLSQFQPELRIRTPQLKRE